MIESQRTALFAVHDVLILVRDMGYNGADGKRIGDALDVAEYLVQLLADREDRTDQFEQALVDLAAHSPLFQSVVDRFRRGVASDDK